MHPPFNVAVPAITFATTLKEGIEQAEKPAKIFQAANPDDSIYWNNTIAEFSGKREAYNNLQVLVNSEKNDVSDQEIKKASKLVQGYFAKAIRLKQVQVDEVITGLYTGYQYVEAALKKDPQNLELEGRLGTIYSALISQIIDIIDRANQAKLQKSNPNDSLYKKDTILPNPRRELLRGDKVSIYRSDSLSLESDWRYVGDDITGKAVVTSVRKKTVSTKILFDWNKNPESLEIGDKVQVDTGKRDKDNNVILEQNWLIIDYDEQNKTVELVSNLMRAISKDKLMQDNAHTPKTGFPESESVEDIYSLLDTMGIYFTQGIRYNTSSLKKKINEYIGGDEKAGGYIPHEIRKRINEIKNGNSYTISGLPVDQLPTQTIQKQDKATNPWKETVLPTPEEKIISEEDKKTSNLLFEEAGKLSEQRKYEEALAIYDQLISLNPKEGLFYHFKGRTLNELGRYEEAIAAYDQAINIDPQNSYVHYKKGNVLIEAHIPQFGNHFFGYE